MTRLPQLKARELISFLKKHGFVDERMTGSHLTMRHVARGLTVTIPVHTSCDIGRGLAVRILKDAGYSVEDYLKEDH